MYVLENPWGRFYVGSTGNLPERIKQHNPSSTDYVGSKYTHKNGPWALVYQESHPDLAAAVRREREIKRKKSARWIRENLLGRVERVPTSRD